MRADPLSAYGSRSAQPQWEVAGLIKVRCSQCVSVACLLCSISARSSACSFANRRAAFDRRGFYAVLGMVLSRFSCRRRRLATPLGRRVGLVQG